MTPTPSPDEPTARVGDGDESANEPRVLLFMRSGRDRELLSETLGNRYRVETTTDVEVLSSQFDCCVFDAPEFNRVAGTVQSRRDTSDPVFLPFVLLIGETSPEMARAKIWDYADDVIEMPVEKVGLLSRIGNLVERRRTAVELAQREAQLEATVEDLTLKEQAMDEAPIGITIAEVGNGDEPLIYANEQFERITGYDSDIIGSDCRFLQGEETDPDTRATIREALDAHEPVSVDILNYRKNGQKFWNKLDIAPVRESEGSATRFVGFQTVITDRKIRERRLEVLNRVLRHNLRNKMNVIEGYTALLEDEFRDEPPDAIAKMKKITSELFELGETVREIDRTISGADAASSVVELDERMKQVLSAFEDRFPAASFDLVVASDDSCEVAATGLIAAIEEAIENAVKHNDSPEPTVKIRVVKRSDEWVEVEIEDDGSGLPKQEIAALRDGEVPLRHSQGLGLWMLYWIVSKAGGRFSVTDADPSGTVVTLSVPPSD
ncbi:MAG: PAS domain-containing protein [Halolamina sp.]